MINLFSKKSVYLYYRAPSATRTRDLLLRRTWAAPSGPGCAQVGGHAKVSVSDRGFPRLAASSATQRARGLQIRRGPYRCPIPFGSVRDLRLVFSVCPDESGRSEAWLPLEHRAKVRLGLVPSALACSPWSVDCDEQRSRLAAPEPFDALHHLRYGHLLGHAPSIAAPSAAGRPGG